MVWYDVVDMFADEAFRGCSLGVVLDAGELSAETMQAIAIELNVSETAFVLSASKEAATYRVRIFTPTKETPFGGHSSIGTAATLVRLGKIAPGTVVQECGSKRLPLRATHEGATLAIAAPWQARDLDPSVLCSLCGLDVGDVVGCARAVGHGPLFHFLPVQDVALKRTRPNLAAMAAEELPDLFVFSWDSASRTAHARLFAPGYDMPEDPACASAALAFGLWLIDAGWLPATDGVHEYVIRQGIEMNWPAALVCAVKIVVGQPVEVSVTGRVIPTTQGKIAIGSLSAGPPLARAASQAGGIR